MTNQQVVVIGLGLFGGTVAKRLFDQNHQVLGIDQNERVVNEIAPYITEAVQADATDETALKDLGVGDYDIAIVGFGRDVPTSLMVTVLLKNLQLPYIVARSHDPLHAATLERIGADKIISPEEETGERLAHSLGYPKVVDYLGVSRNFGISKFVPSETHVGKTLEDIGFSDGTDAEKARVVLMRRGQNEIIYSPDRFEKLAVGDELVIASLDEALDDLMSI
ncbi:MAG: potassium channel family protein [Dehalococcoidia bacterium]